MGWTPRIQATLGYHNAWESEVPSCLSDTSISVDITISPITAEVIFSEATCFLLANTRDGLPQRDQAFRSRAAPWTQVKPSLEYQPVLAVHSASGLAILDGFYEVCMVFWAPNAESFDEMFAKGNMLTHGCILHLPATPASNACKIFSSKPDERWNLSSQATLDSCHDPVFWGSPWGSLPTQPCRYNRMELL